MNYNLSDKKVLITGATGLIGKNLVRRVLEEGAYIIAPVRSIQKAEAIFGKNSGIDFIETDIIDIPIKNYGVDYIIHGASNTSSKSFVETPVDIINTNYQGTLRMLEVARKNSLKGFVYLSTMEIYGAPKTDELIDELHSTNLDTMSLRSSYPESKRACELLCRAYAEQYSIPARVVRLTQTFGPGVQYDDKRVFAEFARCAIEKRDIILHTKGETKRSYLYTEDAVDAILKVLLDGKTGEAYNAANETTYCSVYEMASLVAQKISKANIQVIVDECGDVASLGFAPTLKMNLNTSKLKALGWKPRVGLEEMFRNMIDDMKRGKK